jgi:hypothetical protein
MAIYTLPNSASWDDSLSFENQTDEAQEFWNNLMGSITPTSTYELTSNPNLDRLTSQTWLDTSYSGSYNYQVVITREYQNSPTHQRAFAIRTTHTSLNILDK